MARLIINNGTSDNDPSAEKIRSAFDKVNANFGELYTSSNNVLMTKEANVIINEGDVISDKILDAINALPDFEVLPYNILMYKITVTPSSDNIEGLLAASVYRYFLKGTGTGLYGVNENQLTWDFLEEISIRTLSLDDTIGDDTKQEVELAGNIGVKDVSQYLNEQNPLIPLQSPNVGLRIIIVTRNTLKESYLFFGPAGNYGIAGDTSTIDQFNLLEKTTTPIKYTSQLINNGNNGESPFVQRDELPDFEGFLLKENITDTIGPGSTDDEVPSAKAVYDYTPKRQFSYTLAFGGGAPGFLNGLPKTNVNSFNALTNVATVDEIPVAIAIRDCFIAPFDMRIKYIGMNSNNSAGSLLFGCFSRKRSVTASIYESKKKIFEVLPTASVQAHSHEIVNGEFIPKTHYGVLVLNLSTGTAGILTLQFEEV